MVGVLSIRFWIPSRPSQVLWQDLRADVSSREEKRSIYKTLWIIRKRLSDFVQLSI